MCDTCRRHWIPRRARCPRCAIDLPAGASEGATCQPCEDQSPEFDRAIAAVDYAGPWPALLARLKFRHQTATARSLAALMGHAIRARQTDADLIVPVPLSGQRLAERGFNQSWLIASALSRQLGIPARHDLLARTRHTQRLMALDAEARQQHIQGAFEATPAGQRALEQRHVAIVDDVMTTGATLNDAAHALLEAGARSVSAWVVARTPSPRLPD